MHNNDGLIAAYIFDCQGGARAIEWAEIENFDPAQGFLWVHIDYSAQKPKSWLKKCGLDSLEYQALTAKESRPRSVATTNGMTIFLRGLNINPGQDPEDMVSVRIFLNKHMLITSRRRKILAIENVVEHIASQNSPKSTMELFLLLNNFLNERIENFINKLEDRVEDLEEQVLSSDSRISRETIMDLRREVISLRRYLAPQRVALQSLLNSQNPIISEDDKINLSEAIEKIVRYLEELDAAKEKSAVSFEELSNQISENMNKRMYIMSQVTVIFLPLTFITGLLGMNVRGIPGERYSWTFIIVCSICAFIGLTLLGLFRKKRMM
ncbi:MAG: zinc transporter ZntB [Myxococcales bacterium]|nr:zinc transporter ZntB [Myxococcales bacterium]USN49999.1 MAG: zinc transporter ZntB [Myxococcales bacterium]